ncbi:MAG: type II secretion system secretin GspD, partial [Syntrophales bacterium]
TVPQKEATPVPAVPTAADKEAASTNEARQPSSKKDASSRADSGVKATRKKVKKAALRQKKEARSPAEKNAGVTIDFDNVDIQVFIKSIGEMTGKNFVIDNQVKGNVTIFSPKKISVEEAYKVFESVLEVHGYTTVPAGDVIKIIPAKDAKEKSIETRLKDEVITPEDKVVTQIVSLNHANPDEMKKVLDPLISRSSIVISYPPTGMLVITDVLSNVKRLLRIISALDVAGAGEQISLIALKNASATEVAKSLTAIFQASAAEQQRRGGLSQSVRVLPDERTNTVIVVASEFYISRVKQLIGLLDKEVPKGDASMHVYRLQNANAEDLAKVLMNLPQKEGGKSAEKGKAPIVSKEVQILADKATNTLVITAARDDYKVLEDVIKSLDIPRSMVYLEALIMEVSVNKSFKLGVEWRYMTTAGSNGVFGGSGGVSSQSTPGAYSIFPTPITSGSTTLADFPSGFSFGILGGGITIGGITFPTIGAALQAIQQDQDIHILSTPQILTMDNEDAEIRVGQNVPYLTRQDTATATTGVAYNTYEYRDVGVMLKVNPHISENGFVRLKISQEVTQLSSQNSGIRDVSAPTTLKRTANTTVIVKDNNTVVIGGIIGDSSTRTNYQIPCIGNIPLLGNLFKSKAINREKTNLFVFLTPRIVRTQQEANTIFQEKRSQTDVEEEGTIRLYERGGKDKGSTKQGNGNLPEAKNPQPAANAPNDKSTEAGNKAQK